MTTAEKLTQIAENQQSLYQAGVAKGLSESDYGAGYTAGQQAEYDRFWDAFQKNGIRRNYYSLFCQSGWNDETFNPKYPINCSGSTTNASQVFFNCDITEINIPIIVSGIQMSQTFFNCARLKKIADLTLDGVPNFMQTFKYSSKLESINIKGSIDANIGFESAPRLTDASVQNIIDCLKDLTGQAAQSLTLHPTVGAALTDIQKAAITAKNWTLVY